MKQVPVGVHVSIAGSLIKAFDRAEELGCDCFQIFTKNPRGWKAKPIESEIAREFATRVKRYAPGRVFAHISYLPNLAGENPAMYQKSVEALIMELDRCDDLTIPYLVTHLGHAGDTDAGRDRVVRAIDTAVAKTGTKIILLLENTAGEKNSVGSRIEDIADVYGRVQNQSGVGICFDTCHAFAAGYDLRNEQTVGEFVDFFDETIGLSALHLIHLNDTKGDLGSGLDRHEHIGFGSLGESGIWEILHNPGLRGIPCICETPVDDRRGDKENIKAVRTLASSLNKNKRPI